MTYLTNYNWMKKPYQDGKEDHHPTTPSLFKRTATNILKIRNSIIFTIIFVAFAGVCWGVELHDYKSYRIGDWSILGTWRECTALNPETWSIPSVSPSATNNVIISHEITLETNVSVKNLTITSDGYLLVGSLLTANRILTVENAKVDGKAKIYGSFFVTGNMSGTGVTDVFGALNVTGNATLSGRSIVEGGGTFDVGGTVKLDNTDCLILKSVSGSTGSFTFTSKDAGSTGNLLVERWMSNTNNWHLYSSPLLGETIHSFLLFNQEIPDLLSNPLNPNSGIGVGMREYYSDNDVWSPYYVYGDGLPSGDMIVGKGYSIRTMADNIGGDYTNLGSVYAHGTLNPNEVTVNLHSSTNNWNCIGNPFTSAIDIPKFLNQIITKNISPKPDVTNISNLDPNYPAIYVWDTNNIITIPYKASPAYVPLNLVSSVSIIQISQGFFVKMNSSGSGIVKFTKDIQSPNSSLSFKAAVTEWPSLTLVASNQNLTSSTEIKFVTNATKGLDAGYDAGMLKANPDFALYSKLLVDNSVDFCLQCLPDQNYDQYVIPIGIDCKAGGVLTFTAETVNLPSGCQALLEDRLTKRFTRLDLKDAKYTATVTANTKGTGRFYLHTSDVISSVKPIKKEPFKVNTIGTTVYINGEVSEKANFFVYSVSGKQLANFKAESQVQNQFDASGFPAGVYILTCNDQNQKKSTKFVIKN